MPNYPKNDEKQDLAEVKRLLPLPELMRKIGDGEHAKTSAFCPFHKNTNTEAFSVFQKDGAWFWKCHAGCGHGDGVDYLEKRFGLSTGDAIARYRREADLNDAADLPQCNGAFDWAKDVAAFTDSEAKKLAAWRGYSPAFVDWLRREKLVGLHGSKVAFAVHKESRVAACHYRSEAGDGERPKWKYYPTGIGMHPLVFGDVPNAATVLCFESQWDAFAVMDKLDRHKAPPPKTAVFITRGADNGKRIAGQCSPAAVIYAFVQNDTPDPKTGRIAGEVWLADVAARAGCKVVRVGTPAPHKDANDWTRAGGTRADIQAAMSKAKPVEPAQKPIVPTTIESCRPLPVEPPASPMDFNQWKAVISNNFPTYARPAETCASVVAQLLLNDVANPFALALVDVPSSGKTITLNFFDVSELAYTTDNFTPASCRQSRRLRAIDAQSDCMAPRQRTPKLTP